MQVRACLGEFVQVFVNMAEAVGSGCIEAGAYEREDEETPKRARKRTRNPEQWKRSKRKAL